MTDEMQIKFGQKLDGNASLFENVNILTSPFMRGKLIKNVCRNRS